MKVGALNYYTKPLDLKKFISEIKQLLGRSHSHNESEDYIISKSTEMKQLIDEAKKVAKTDAPVLITGESGTGKELFARLIHHTSNRSKEPFITINCAAIPENLLESELFGFEKGAFTNAHTTKIGKIEAASGGTLFLDEIGDMDLRLQAKILRVLQENEIERIGSNQVIKTNFRLISATNKNLREEFGKNTFREDLFYRLSVVSIHLLSLRERLIDINALTKYFIDIFNKKYSKNILGVTSAVDSILHRHKWPGNVRELKNCLERAVIFCEYEYLDIDNLPYQYQIMTEINNSNIAIEEKEHHRKIIEKALNDSNGVKQKAAELLNINRRTLYNRMKKLGML
jgi:two-component system response regulator AtoC